MLSITDGGSLARVLSSPLDHRLKRLLTTRTQQLGDGEAHFLLIQPGDTPCDIEQELSFSVFQNPVTGDRYGDPDFVPAWEWLEDHGFCFEVVFILTDSGFAHVLLVPRDEGIDADLLALCATFEHA